MKEAENILSHTSGAYLRNGCSSFQQCMRNGVLMGRLDAPYRQKDFPLTSLEVGIMHLSFVPPPWGQVAQRFDINF